MSTNNCTCIILLFHIVPPQIRHSSHQITSSYIPCLCQYAQCVTSQCVTSLCVTAVSTSQSSLNMWKPIFCFNPWNICKLLVTNCSDIITTSDELLWYNHNQCWLFGYDVVRHKNLFYDQIYYVRKFCSFYNNSFYYGTCISTLLQLHIFCKVSMFSCKNAHHTSREYIVSRYVWVPSELRHHIPQEMALL